MRRTLIKLPYVVESFDMELGCVASFVEVTSSFALSNHLLRVDAATQRGHDREASRRVYEVNKYLLATRQPILPAELYKHTNEE